MAFNCHNYPTYKMMLSPFDRRGGNGDLGKLKLLAFGHMTSMGQGPKSGPVITYQLPCVEVPPLTWNLKQQTLTHNFCGERFGSSLAA